MLEVKHNQPHVTDEKAETLSRVFSMEVEPIGLLSQVLCPHSPQMLDVRLGYSLCPEELEFLQKRNVVVAEALKQVLQLEEDLQMDEVGKQRSAAWARCLL